MKRTLLLFLLIFFLPINTKDSGAAAAPDLARTTRAIEPRLQALDQYKESLQSREGELNDQGVLIETSDSGQTLAEHNADVAFNPASVMK
ncbi:MAG TPA: hypothetical protein VFB82_21350, partial [Blastocatellia bacterium]|nr:hypothetical protein [Blastocatellia bacterium]